jgi:ubiquinone/menaquinone biosynthesis C-methylase UbiE
MSQEVANFFNDFSVKYENDVVNNYFKNKHKWMFKQVPPLTGKKVLDIGCGPGELARVIKTIYLDCKVTGLDISSEMIKFAEKKSIGLSGIDFLVGDSHSLPFEDNSFDYLFNTISFHHYEDPNKVLKEMNRILKPGGRLYLLDSIKNPGIISFMPWYWDYKDSKQCYSKHLTSRQFRNLFTKSNFQEVNYKYYFNFFPAVHILCMADKQS